MSSYFLRTNGLLAEVDLSQQRLSLEAAKDIGWDDFLDLSIEGDSEPAPFLLTANDPKPFRSIAKAVGRCSTVPLMAFAHKAKLFNDWLYATLDSAAFLGDCPVLGKQALVKHLASSLKDKDEILSAKALLYAAQSLGDGAVIEGLSGKLRLLTKKQLKSFEKDALKSKPIGFYSESELLQRLFRHDRILQTKLKAAEAERLAAAIAQANLSEAYNWHLRAIESLTGKHAMLPVSSLIVPDEMYSLFPPSKAPETDLIKKLYGTRPIPEGFCLLDEVIARVKDDRLSLKPEADDGWYLRELYALESFLKLEDERIQIGEYYQDSLEQLFKGSMSLSRETHIKQLEVPRLSGSGQFTVPEIAVAPRLRLEPFPEYYQRMASNYAWLSKMLCKLWGEPFLPEKVAKRDGQHTSILDALDEMRSLFLGAYYLCLEDLGHSLPEQCDGEMKLSMIYARQFLKNWTKDPEILTDSRMMVPLYYDLTRQRTRVSVVCGYVNRDVTVNFARTPEVRVMDAKGQDTDVPVTWQKSSYKTVYPIQFECDVVELLERESLQAIADQHPSPSELRVALEGLS